MRRRTVILRLSLEEREGKWEGGLEMERTRERGMYHVGIDAFHCAYCGLDFVCVFSAVLKGIQVLSCGI